MMKNQRRSKKDIIEELEAMHQRIAELELLEAERSQSEKSLRDSEESFRLLSDATFEGIVIHDKGVIIEVNLSLSKMFGYDKEEAIGKHVLEFAAPESRELATRNITSGYEMAYEAVGIKKDGSRIFCEFRGRTILYKGRFVRVAAIRDITERKRSEQALRESEARFRRLVESNIIGVIFADLNGKITEANDAFLNIVGYSHEDLIAGKMNWVEMTPSEFHHLNQKGIEEAAQTGACTFFEREFYHKNGSRVPVLIGGFPLHSDLCDWFCLVLDLTERKKMEEALKQSQQKYEDLVNSIDGIFWEADARTFQLTFVSKRAERLLGYPVGRWYEPGFWKDHVHPEDVDWAVSFCQKATLEIRDHEFEYRMLAADGRTVWLRDIVSVIAEKEPFAKILKGVMIDITERKLAEQALKMAEERLRTVVANSPIVLFSIDQNGVVTLSEGRGLDLLGLKPGEVVGRSVFKLYSNEPNILAGIRRALSGEAFTEVVEVGKRFFETHYTPLRDQNNQFVGVIGVATDITEKKKMEEEMLRASKLESVGLLAGGIAHDFNNILTAIIGNLSLAKTQVKPQDELFQRLNDIEKASLMAKNLTQQLLTFSQGGAPIVETTSIGELLKEYVLFALRGSNVNCIFSIPSDLWQVDIDEGQMNQVINNLIINAVQAMPQGGLIKVKAENIMAGVVEGLPIQSIKYVRISIQDQGIGIPKEDLQKIFDPYFTTKQGGSGLGLATSYSIIKKHDGYITVESEENIGTTFFIYLPTSQREVKKKRRDSDAIPVSQGRVLIMDDKAIIRELVSEMLSRLGFTVDCAEDGAEAIDLYKKAKVSGNPYDAIILDLTIPGGMGGKETIERLREIDPGVKGIVSSGYSNDPIMSNFQQYGFRGVVAKPYRIEELKKVLNKVIAG
jgi:PAS domain S-box-containing protein